MNEYVRPAQSMISRRSILLQSGLAAAALGLGGCANYGNLKGGSGTAASSSTLTVPTSDIPVGGGKIYADAKAVVTQPTAGTFKAFTNICTHQQCPVADVTTTINCTCHGSKFSITDGSVVHDPATQPLAAKTVKVDGSNLTVS